MSRGNQYGDQRQGSRAESHREPIEGTRQRDREPTSRNREPSSRNREPPSRDRELSNRDREPSDRDREPSSRDRQSRHESRDQLDGRHAKHERHSDRNVDATGGNDATNSDRLSCTMHAIISAAYTRSLSHVQCHMLLFYHLAVHWG